MTAISSAGARSRLSRFRQALAEIVRVVRPGGRVVIPGPDTGTRVVNSPGRDLTGRIPDYFCGNVVNGWTGRQPPGMRKESGLTNVTIPPSTLISTNIALVHEHRQRSIASNARDAGVVSAGEAADRSDGLEKAGHNEGFRFSKTAFIVSGRKA